MTTTVERRDWLRRFVSVSVLASSLSDRVMAAERPRLRLLARTCQAAGIFVLLIGNLGSHHTALDVELFRGFALSDKVAPFVVIANDQDSEQAWSFTLLHELAHIWLGQTGVSSGRPTSAIETFCNDVAGRVLLPSDEIARETALRGAGKDVVSRTYRRNRRAAAGQSFDGRL